MTIKVVVLGSGAALPSVERGLPAVGIRFDGEVLLFDCGEGTQRQMMRFGLSYAKVKAIFVTHTHADHIAGLVGLTQTLDLIERKEPLLIFGPRGSAATMETMLSISGYGYNIVIEDIEAGFVYKGKGYSVKAFETEHSRASIGYVFKENNRRNFKEKECKAMGINGVMFKELEEKGEIEANGKKIKYEDVSSPRKGVKIVYTGDCVPSEKTVEAAKGADLLIHEGTFAGDKEEKAVEHKHSTVTGAAEIAKKAGVEKLVLTHLSARYKENAPLEEEAKKVFENTVVAEDGMEFEF